MLKQIILLLSIVCITVSVSAQRFAVMELLELYKAQSEDRVVQLATSKGLNVMSKNDSMMQLRTRAEESDSTFEKIVFRRNSLFIQAFCYRWSAFNNWIAEIESLGFQNEGHSMNEFFSAFYLKGDIVIILSAEKTHQTGVTIITIVPKSDSPFK